MKRIFTFVALLILPVTLKADWVQVNNGLTQLNVNALTVSTSGGVNSLWAGTSPSFNGGGVFLSTNNGDNWSLSFNDNNYEWALATSVNGGINYIFAGSSSSLVYTTNNGTNWNYTIFPNGSHWFYSLAANGNNIFVGCKYFSSDPGGVYKSSNYGLNWVQTSVPTCQFGDYNALAINGNNVYASGFCGTFISTNNGTNWTQSNSSVSFLSFAISGNYIFGGGDGVYVSSNNGTNWTQTSLNNYTIYALLVYGNSVFAAGGGVWISTDNGANWIQRVEGLGGFARSLCISNGYIYAGTDGHGIYRRPLSELVGIRPISEEVPQDYELKQNYPNPFNPVTTFKFALPKSSHAKLTVYDLLGRTVTVIVNEQLTAGNYKISWDASNYSSGVYFYRNQTNDFSQVKKMVLIK